MPSVKDWIVTFRLRTLPLSLSSIILGSFLAAFRGGFRWNVFVLAALTTLSLQILSNLANDYGDAVRGVDNHGRVGPKRSLQTGAITLKEMKYAVILFVMLSLISGIMLLYLSMKDMKLTYGLIMFVIGLLAIAAALKYTVGKNPYGYAGLGDVSVFVFFGLVGVLGSYYLYTHEVGGIELLPAASIGFFSAGVLNLNNLRDRENDAAFGKKTIVVQLGLSKAKKYHAIILTLGMLAAVVYVAAISASAWKWAFVVSFPLFTRSIVKVAHNRRPKDLESELRNLSLSTLLFSILLGAGLML